MATAAADSLRKILGEKIKCTLDDGRSATGIFICLDRHTNLILTDVTEERWINTSDYSLSKQEKMKTVRLLSQAMVPGDRLVKVEVEKAIYEKL